MLLGGLGAAALALPTGAQAHGIVGKADLPIPVWLFSWTAAIVLVVSFVALSTLWLTPQLQSEHPRRLLALPAPLEWLASALGLGLFALVLYSGFAGVQQAPAANFAVTLIYIAFWIGMPIASVLFGDVFRALSPWRTCARILAALSRRLRPRPGGQPARLGSSGLPPDGQPVRQASSGPPLRYPAWLGMWPAVAGIVGFAWLELVYVLPNRDRPSTLAALSLGYFVAMLAGMTLYGVEEWGARADGFGAYFNLVSRLSALTRGRDGALYLRRPLSGVTSLEIRPGTIVFICALIGTTTFDGFSNGGIWRNNEPSLQSLFEGLGCSATPALELAYTLGLLACIALIVGIYRLGVLGVRSVGDSRAAGEIARAFAHTLVPIGFAYVAAHYFSLLLWQGQAMAHLISDPLGSGANIFGTSGYRIDYRVLSYAGIWYVQVAALVAGHVGGLALAHDRALTLYEDPEEAVRSQYWMLAVMVAFTSFGLWLLSSVGT
jgi:hypothetical protein